MSDSEDSARLPSEPRIEQALRQAVVSISQSDNHLDLTVNRIRAAAETDLDLPAGFLKSSAEWKDRSKDFILNAVEAHEAKQGTEPASPAISSKKPAKNKGASGAGLKSKAKPVPQKAKAVPAPQNSKKRQSADVKPNAHKRRKVSESTEEQSESPLSDVEDASDALSEPDPVPKKSRLARTRQARVVSEDEEPVEASEDDASEPQPAPAPAPIEGDNGNLSSVKYSPAPPISKREDASESELSEVLDEAPAPKKSRKKSGADKATTSAKPKPSKVKKDSTPDPDEAEIKRLQGWLIKCGIRKLWHRELASYDTSKAKINHLKRMLKDAGMDGRYSAEKAKQIKEQRELAADLEAVQEGAKRWGQAGSGSGSEGESGGQRPTRRLAKGLRNLEFLGDDDGEETD